MKTFLLLCIVLLLGALMILLGVYGYDMRAELRRIADKDCCVTLPQCPENEAILGIGEFDNGTWSEYICWVAVDDCEATEIPTREPTATYVWPTDKPPTIVPPTIEPTQEPTITPTDEPTQEPTVVPTIVPTQEPKPTEMPKCNKGGGNGSEGCDPGNHPEKGHDDE